MTTVILKHKVRTAIEEVRHEVNFCYDEEDTKIANFYIDKIEDSVLDGENDPYIGVCDSCGKEGFMEVEVEEGGALYEFCSLDCLIEWAQWMKGEEE